jgi:hypothetical protein
LTGEYVVIYQTRPLEFPIQMRGRFEKLTVMGIIDIVSCGVSIKNAQLAAYIQAHRLNSLPGTSPYMQEQDLELAAVPTKFSRPQGLEPRKTMIT